MAVNPYNRYQEQAIMTMTNGEMLVKLYEKAASQLQAAIVAIENNDMSGAQPCLNRAQDIINYLRITLNHQYDISARLESLYTFFNQQIVESSIKRDAKKLREVIPMLEELRDTFHEADKRARQQGATLGQGLSNSYG